MTGLGKIGFFTDFKPSGIIFDLFTSYEKGDTLQTQYFWNFRKIGFSKAGFSCAAGGKVRELMK